MWLCLAPGLPHWSVELMFYNIEPIRAQRTQLEKPKIYYPAVYLLGWMLSGR